MTTTTTHPDRTAYNCPDWCTRTDHYLDECEDGRHYHYAPDFGAVSIQACGDGAFEVEVHDEDLGGIEGLLKHGRDVIAAAEWLEARR